ncbi:MAG: DNA integrity scanning diadenylate cyclase DisA [Actinomycetota bacterium]
MAARFGSANDEMRTALSRVAPGTPIRDGIERVVRSKAGALIVLADSPEVLSICTGGFLVDAPYSPQRLSELAKMDGAIIVSTDGGRIARANVHLVPDPTVHTSETGTRHRTAERVARSLDVPVVSASEEMGVINVYAGGEKRELQEVGRLLDRANQALQTLGRYRIKLDESVAELTADEVQDVATLRDVARVVQRGDLVHRIADEIETMIIELGVDARLLRMQLDEIYGEIDDELELVIADYVPPEREVIEVLQEMADRSDAEVRKLKVAIRALGLAGDDGIDLSDGIRPRGLRLLRRVNRMTPEVARAITDRFPTLADVQRASIAELSEIDGVDAEIAANVRETLSRLTESAILEQYS